jgi:hypothetical protein
MGQKVVGEEPPAASGYSVEVVGVQVGAKGFDYDEKWKRYQTMPFNMHKSGIEVAFILSSPDGGIIEMDDDESQVTLFKDDKKTDLLAAPEDTPFGNEPGFGSFPKVSDDGKGLLFTVKSPVLPAAGTRLVGVAGRLALLTGTTQATAEAKAVDLKEGTAFTLGSYDFEVKKVGKPDWGDDAMAVTLKTSRELEGVIEFTFLAGDGSELESSEAGSSTMRFGNMVSVDKTFNFKQEVTTPVTISMTYWADMKRVKVPFRAKTGLMP